MIAAAFWFCVWLGQQAFAVAKCVGGCLWALRVVVAVVACVGREKEPA
jgi:hypothetical protein